MNQDTKIWLAGFGGVLAFVGVTAGIIAHLDPDKTSALVIDVFLGLTAGGAYPFLTHKRLWRIFDSWDRSSR